MMHVDSTDHYVRHPDVTAAIKSFVDAQKLAVSFSRFENLYTVLYEKIQDHSHNDFRCILFVKQRVTTHILKHVLEGHNQLGSLVKAQCIYSTKTPATASLSISKQASKDALGAFATGLSNMLIATNVAEEGIDIPEANCVIYWDPMDHAVSYVQGRGRARHSKSSFVMLSERVDRPASMLAQQEAQQHAVASSFRPTISASSGKIDEVAQKSRERGALSFLLNPTVDNSLGNLNIYCKKTKAVLEEKTVKTKGSSCFTCNLTYRSVTITLSNKGMAQTKKMAKRNAAVELLKAIKVATQNP
eukprot:scaffold83_cov57-Cyclotella_meneghiniana.AAC.3